MDRGPYEVIWTEAAADDLERIVDFIAERNPERAVEIFDHLRQRVAHLSTHPLRSRLVPELKAIGLDAYRELLIPPYRALLRLQGRKIFILGFFDGRRDMEEVLFERLTRH